MSEPRRDMYDFPNCMHALSAAMHRHNIAPSGITISLPRDEWWRLWCRLEHIHRGMMTFDGRGKLVDHFTYMGFKFTVSQ